MKQSRAMRQTGRDVWRCWQMETEGEGTAILHTSVENGENPPVFYFSGDSFMIRSTPARTDTISGLHFRIEGDKSVRLQDQGGLFNQFFLLPDKSTAVKNENH
ncbi:MAG: hypothetical protein R3C61_00880 [Bacteroidia bacterium]